jgi:hypothetical protein
MEVEEVNLEKKKEMKEKIISWAHVKDAILQFHLWLLFCAATFRTVKHKYDAMYSCFTGQLFTGSVRDALRASLTVTVKTRTIKPE